MFGHTPLIGALLGVFIFEGMLRFWCGAFFVPSKSGHFLMCRLGGKFSQINEIPSGKITSFIQTQLDVGVPALTKAELSSLRVQVKCSGEP